MHDLVILLTIAAVAFYLMRAMDDLRDRVAALERERK